VALGGRLADIVLVLVVPTSLIAESLTRQTKSYVGQAVLVLDLGRGSLDAAFRRGLRRFFSESLVGSLIAIGSEP
jgi:hypothetical protein